VTRIKHRIAKCDLPGQSLLHGYIRPGDFVDCYRCQSQLDVDSAAASAMAFPGWADWLLRLRNIVVIPFGLTAAIPKGETIGNFPVDQRTDTEVILGFDDSHLNFRISILTDGNHAYVSTWVHRNNALGRAYLAVIMPFHVLIMRNAITQVAKAPRAGGAGGMARG
jgi:Protein of unknown function (DUF2867)